MSYQQDGCWVLCCTLKGSCVLLARSRSRQTRWIERRRTRGADPRSLLLPLHSDDWSGTSAHITLSYFTTPTQGMVRSNGNVACDMICLKALDCSGGERLRSMICRGLDPQSHHARWSETCLEAAHVVRDDQSSTNSSFQLIPRV